MKEQDLKPESKKVLKTVLESGSIRGFDLSRRTEVKDKQLIEAVTELVGRGFITASGPVCTDTIDMVRFAPLSYGLENSSICNNS